MKLCKDELVTQIWSNYRQTSKKETNWTDRLDRQFKQSPKQNCPDDLQRKPSKIPPDLEGRKPNEPIAWIAEKIQHRKKYLEKQQHL